MVAAGADAIGVNFYPPSPRCVDLETAKGIVAAVDPFVTVVGLFVDEPAEQVRRTLAELPMDVLQFHGDETAQYCAQFQRPWVKAVRMQPDSDLLEVARAFDSARALLLDTYKSGVPGGTGETFDWGLARATVSLPLVLAGGLNEYNVGAAIEQVRPAAVDVSGGVESSPGVKDPEKVERFVAAVRAADEALHQSV